MSRRRAKKKAKREPASEDDASEDQLVIPSSPVSDDPVPRKRQRKRVVQGKRRQRRRDVSPESSDVNGDEDLVGKDEGSEEELEDDPSLFRILVATDNHVGYLRADPIRGDDSFRSFEEALQVAAREEVDMVLLGGDIFHHNKPSRETMLRTVNIFKKYVLGTRPISFEVLSDPATTFASGVVNHLDPTLSIGMSVMSICGNHDDPAGPGKTSAIDLISAAGLVNYFGMAKEPHNILIRPILLRKGNTKIALYGLGAIRDERLYRTFQKGDVRWARPAEDQDSWYNIFVLHQNRTRHAALLKNFVHERMLPTWLDLVIWGHEHECIMELEERENFYILQPGSSVATSLCRGEAVPKAVGVLEIKEGNARLVPVPLTTVRPMIMEDVSLADLAEADGVILDADDIAEIERLCREHVESILEREKKKLGPHERDDKTKLPLVRVRVDYTGYSKINNVARFGQVFQGKVANPKDILLFTKRARQRAGAGEQRDDQRDDTNLLIAAEPNAAPPIHDIVNSILSRESGLSVLSSKDLSEVVRQYVEKRDTGAIQDYVETAIEKTQRDFLQGGAVANRSDLEARLAERAEADRRSAEVQAAKASKDAEARKERAAAAAAVKPEDGVKDEEEEEEEDDDDAFEDVKPAARRRSRASKRKKEEPVNLVSDESESDDAGAASSKRKRSSRAAKSSRSTRSSRSSRASRAATAAAINLDSSEEDDDDDGGPSSSAAAWGKKKRSSRRRRN